MIKTARTRPLLMSPRPHAFTIIRLIRLIPSVAPPTVLELDCPSSDQLYTTLIRYTRKLWKHSLVVFIGVNPITTSNICVGDKLV